MGLQASEPVITYLVLRICAVMMLHRGKLSPYTIAKEMRVDYTSVWMACTRLEKTGWFESELEVVNASISRRPRRRMYRFTDRGRSSARTVLANLQIPELSRVA